MKTLEQKEPELLQHLADLVEHHKKGSPVIIEYKKAIGECKRGNFNTPFFNAVKKRILTKQWGREAELGSWKQVLDRVGHNVAYAALRQGTLPYVPHSLLLPGHGVKWPESHEFVLTRKFWKETWQSEVEFRDDDPEITQKAIKEFLDTPGNQSEAHQTWEELTGTVMRGIPNGEEMETPVQAEPAATATSVKSEFERSIHPEFCGVKYDELHSTTVKNITKVTGQWPGKKQKFEVDVAKAEAHPMCANSEALAVVKSMIGQADDEYLEIDKTNKMIQVKGRGYLSTSELEATNLRTEAIWKHDKALVEYIKSLKNLSALPIVKAPPAKK